MQNNDITLSHLSYFSEPESLLSKNLLCDRFSLQWQNFEQYANLSGDMCFFQQMNYESFHLHISRTNIYEVFQCTWDIIGSTLRYELKLKLTFL